LRITVGSPEENQRTVDRIAAILTWEKPLKMVWIKANYHAIFNYQFVAPRE
jgi:hypothetical protein